MIMPVVEVWKVRVTMPQADVHMPVRVRLPRWLGAIMGVLVMLVMLVPVLVGHLMVLVLVCMALCQMKPDAEGHERTGRNELDRHRVPQQHDRDQGSEERSEREVCSGPRRPDVSKSDDEEHQADAVAGKSYSRRGSQHPGPWQCRPEPDRDGDIHHPGHNPLQKCDLHRVRLRDLAGQVVVEGPAETRAGDRGRTEYRAQDQTAAPCQDQSARDDGYHASRDAAVEVLAEDEPGKERRKHAFQVQQESGSRRGGMREADHEQYRPDNAASEIQSAPRMAASRRAPEPSARPAALSAIRPRPDPRYRSPASIHGSLSRRSSLASGVLAPNRRADRRARPAPEDSTAGTPFSTRRIARQGS